MSFLQTEAGQESYYTTGTSGTRIDQNMTYSYAGELTGMSNSTYGSVLSSIANTFASLPFGDGYTPTGTDPDPSHFAVLDHDAESNTDHAQFRQYSPTSATWMSPDPYDGSYNQMDPQSLNRYVYAGNNPLLYVDPAGEDYTICGTNQDASSGKIVVTCFSLPGQPLPVDPAQLLFFLESLAMRTIQNFNPGGPGSSGGQQGGSTGSGGSGAQAPSNAPMFPRGTAQAISKPCAAAANSIGTAHNWAVNDGAIATAIFTGAGLSPAGKVFGKILGEVGLIFGTAAGVEGTYAYFGGKLYSAAGCPAAPPVP